MGNASRRRHRGQAIGECPKKDAKRPLGRSIPGKADQDAWRELHRGKRQGHQENSEDDRDHGHRRCRDDAKDTLRDLRIGRRREQRVRHPTCKPKVRLLDRGEHRPAGAENERYDRWADEKAASQSVGGTPEAKGEILQHRGVSEPRSLGEVMTSPRRRCETREPLPLHRAPSFPHGQAACVYDDHHAETTDVVVKEKRRREKEKVEQTQDDML